MEQISIRDVTFFYPVSQSPALDSVSLDIKSGEYILVCGKSGCGKTTLLRQLKKEIAPHGRKTGEIIIDGQPSEAMSLRAGAEKIGFVSQDTELQTVTDKVWHELAFGLENLGLDTNEIRLRVAEISAFFGIDEWFNKKTAELSGGQRQILSLAAVMSMYPEILILDEPTSQLDAIAAESFLQTVGRINREFGTTVIISEQRLEEVFAYADRVVVMDNGRIVSDASPSETGAKINGLPQFMRLSAPAAVRIFGGASDVVKCPVTVREGRRRLIEANCSDEIKTEEPPLQKPYAVEMKNIYFRYGRQKKDVLRNLSLKIPDRSFFAVLGGNGVGKTTLVKIIAGVLAPYSGKIRYCGEPAKKNKRRISVLPQSVQAVFTEKTVYLDLKEVKNDGEAIMRAAEITGITELFEKHPFDLSGGEQQRAALAKVILCEPEILLLDEPTKGMDGEFKVRFAEIIKKLTQGGCTVIMISHDVEFCAKYADFCAMLFDGEIAAAAPAREFFLKNRFYTTAACRIARGIIKGAVTDGDIKKCLKEKSRQF